MMVYSKRQIIPLDKLKLNSKYQLICPEGGYVTGNNKTYLPKHCEVVLVKIEDLTYAVRTGKHYIFSNYVCDSLTLFEVDYGSNWWLMGLV